MKKLLMAAVLVAGSFMVQNLHAQVRVNLDLNLGNQPVWGPTGYDRADYYYMPDIDCYYDVNRRQFVYNNRGNWVYTSTLPSRYHYDLYNGYKVVVNEPQPWMHADVYRNKYRDRSHRDRQTPIRDSREEKYYQVKGHPMHNQWMRTHRNDGNRDGRDHNDGRDHH